MTTLLTIEVLNLTTTVIVHKETRLSEPKNSAMLAKAVLQDRLLTPQPAHAHNPYRELDANAMSKTMQPEEHVSDAKMAILEPTLMEHQVKQQTVSQPDVLNSCHGCSILTQLHTITLEVQHK